MWGSSSSDVFAVGDGGAILHYDGTNWNAMVSPTSSQVQSRVGKQQRRRLCCRCRRPYPALQRDKLGRDDQQRKTFRSLGVWGSSGSHVFAVGAEGVIVHFDGTNWSAMTSGVDVTLFDVRGGAAAAMS